MRLRFRIRTHLILVALAAVGLAAIPAVIRDRRELTRLDRCIKHFNCTISLCKQFRLSTDPPASSGFFPGSRWETISSLIRVDHPPFKTWDDERDAFDRQIAQDTAQLLSIERRRDRIRLRWLFLF